MVCRRWARKDGQIAMLMVILCFILVMVVDGYIEIQTRNYVRHEVQSMMDVAGVAAIRTGIDQEKIRLEQFSLDQELVEAHYEGLLASQLSKIPEVKRYRIMDTQVSVQYSTFGLGITSKPLHQGILDSTVLVTIEGSKYFDVTPGQAKSFYDAKSGNSFSVSYAGEAKDGRIELLIRSVSRVVYRQ